MTSLCTLPPELLSQILDYLSNRDLLVLAKLGSRFLRTISVAKYSFKAAFVLCDLCAYEKQGFESTGDGGTVSPPALLTSALQRCKDTPIFTTSITELCLQYDTYHSSSCMVDLDCDRRRIMSAWSLAMGVEMPMMDQTMLSVIILRGLTRLDTLNMIFLPESKIPVPRERPLWHLLYIAAFCSAVPVFGPLTQYSRNSYALGKIHHYSIAEKELREGPQYLKGLRILRCSGNSGYITNLVMVLPAFFFPKIETITVYNVIEGKYDDFDSMSTWFQPGDPDHLEIKSPASTIPDSFHGSSNISNLMLINAWLRKEALATLLLLPRRLKRFSFKHMATESGFSGIPHEAGESDEAYSKGRLLHPRDLIQTLNQSPAGATLEDIRLEYHQMIQHPEDINNNENPRVGWVGSFVGFSNLKRLSVPLWMLLRPPSIGLDRSMDISSIMGTSAGMGTAPLNSIWTILPHTLEGLDLGIYFPWPCDINSAPCYPQNVLWFDHYVCVPLRHIICSTTGNPRFASLREVFLTFRGHGTYGAGGILRGRKEHEFYGSKYMEFRRWLLGRSYMWRDLERTANRLGVKVRMKNYSSLADDDWVDASLEMRKSAIVPEARILAGGGFCLVDS